MSGKLDEEKKVAEEIRRQAEQIAVPESLQPEEIEKMLHGKKQKQRKRYGTFIAAACACVVVGLGSYTWYQAATTNESPKPPHTIAGAESEPAKAGAEVADADKTEGKLAAAKDYEEIAKYLETESVAENDTNTGNIESYGIMSGAKNTQGADMAAAPADHSRTNTREDNVGEADIVKTDGKYLYILSGTKVNIVDIQDKEMKALATISLDTEGWAHELYVEDGRMIVFYQRTENVLNHSYETVASVYDISDPGNPTESGEVSQAGDYRSMRMSDGYIYLFTQYFVYGFERSDSKTYVPWVNGALMESGNIYLPGGTRGAVYTVVSSFDPANPEKIIDSKAILTEGGEMYVSEKSIYLYDALYYGDDQGKTCIQKVNYEKGKLTGAGQTKIEGRLNDSFCIDESDGYLRLVMTVDGENNRRVMPLVLPEDTADTDEKERDGEEPEEDKPKEDDCVLYVLDEKLKECGKIDNLAPGEQVYSARLMGDIGYFVTYEQIDPLFSVDLSDPKNPKIIGKLKIPGFSEYLHFYGDGLLLGIGQDMDETGVTSGGVKLSMFDISDPTDVKEVQKEVLEGIYSTNATYDYKTVLADPGKNLIGFNGYSTLQHYFVYSYGKDGFVCRLDREIPQYADQVRGVYAGEKFYLLQGGSIESFDIKTFEKIGDIVL